MGNPPEHTMALCATCRRAIYVWYDRSIWLAHDEEVDSFIYATQRHGHWAHWVPSTDGHDAMPLLSNRRSLLCAKCRQPQVLTAAGWHCANADCPGRLDKA